MSVSSTGPDSDPPDMQSSLAESLEPALLAEIGRLAAELQPGISLRDVRLDSSLEKDLAIDSLGRMELVVRLEDRFGISLPEEGVARAESVADLMALLQVDGGEGASLERAAWFGPGLVLPHDEVAEAMPDSAATVPEVLEWHVERHPERLHVLLYEEGETPRQLSYGELYRGASRFAAGLQTLGVGAGDAVAIMLPTSMEYFYCFYGALLAGAVPVPLYPPARPTHLEDHLRRQVRILENCGAPVLVTIQEAKALARLLRAQVSTMREIVTPEDLRREARGHGRVSPRGCGEDLAFLQYTSGSTGQPKGVMLTHSNLLENLRGMVKAVGVSSTDVFVSWLPLYHDMGLIGAGMGSLYVAFPLVLMSPLHFLARPARWLQTISRHGGTVSAGPNFAYDLCLAKVRDEEMEGVDLSSWRLAFNGAEAVRPETLRRFAERFAPYGLDPSALKPVYGLAESSLGVSFPPPERPPLIDRIVRRSFVRESRAVPAPEGDDTALEVAACGQPLAGHQLRVADERGRELPDRAIGRVQFRGPSCTAGYFRNPEATSQLFDGEWLDSGDVGYIVGGEIYLTGRSKDIIIRAGRNISPYEIEEAAGAVDGVRAGCVAAFGTASVSDSPSAAGAERLIVLAETRETDPQARERLRAEIVAVTTDVSGAAPDEVVLAPPGTVLKTSSGKIRRSASREVFESGRVGRGRPAPWRQLASLGASSVLPQLRRGFRTAGHYLYSAWAWCVFAAVLAVGAPFVVFVPGLRRRQWLTRQAARLVVWLAGVPFEVNGEENLVGLSTRDRGGSTSPYVVAANHASYADAVVMVAALPSEVSLVAKGELRGIPVVGWLLGHVGVLYVERFEHERSVRDARRLDESLANGRSLGFFPEGTFTRMPGLLPFRMGTFASAATAGAPVVPAALQGVRSVLRADQWLLRRHPVRVTILPPILPRGADWAAAVDLRDRARAALLEHTGEPDLVSEREEGMARLRARREEEAGRG